MASLRERSPLHWGEGFGNHPTHIDVMGSVPTKAMHSLEEDGSKDMISVCEQPEIGIIHDHHVSGEDPCGEFS